MASEKKQPGQLHRQSVRERNVMSLLRLRNREHRQSFSERNLMNLLRLRNRSEAQLLVNRCCY